VWLPSSTVKPPRHAATDATLAERPEDRRTGDYRSREEEEEEEEDDDDDEDEERERKTKKHHHHLYLLLRIRIISVKYQLQTRNTCCSLLLRAERLAISRLLS